MERVPILKIGEILLVSIQVDMQDQMAMQLQADLGERIVETGCSGVIIDITGVPAVDTQVAQHLLKTVMAARLMGAECIVSGIRPQIAQTIVALGIEFGDIPTKATLADALRTAIRLSGSEVTSSAMYRRER